MNHLSRFQGCKVLCLASGGGQQAPIVAALGADVTLLDASAKQLAQDQFVAQRDNLTIRLVDGDMADLSGFADESEPQSAVSTIFTGWHTYQILVYYGGNAA